MIQDWLEQAKNVVLELLIRTYTFSHQLFYKTLNLLQNKRKAIGILLIPTMVILCWWNETRISVLEFAECAVTLTANQQNQTLVSDTLIHTTGQIISDEILGDNLFLQPGKYIAIDRQREKYDSGDEDESAHWDNRENKVFKVSHATIGLYDLDIKNLRIPFSERLSLTPKNTTFTEDFSLVEDYIFKGRMYPLKILREKSTLDHPADGDTRFSYQVLKDNTIVTLFGQLASNHRILPYIDEASHQQFYRLLVGSYEQAMDTLKHEYLQTLWLGRGGIFLTLIMAICLIIF